MTGCEHARQGYESGDGRLPVRQHTAPSVRIGQRRVVGTALSLAQPMPDRTSRLRQPRGSCASLPMFPIALPGGNMTQWTDLLLGSAYGLGSLIVIVAMLGVGGFLAWFLITRSR